MIQCLVQELEKGCIGQKTQLEIRPFGSLQKRSIGVGLIGEGYSKLASSVGIFFI